MQLVAAELAGVRLQPGNHLRTGALGASILSRYEIVNVNMVPPSQFCSDHEAGDTQDFTRRFNVSNLITELPLFS